MWLTILLIVLALAMALGPVMLLQPSSGLQKLAKIRLLANQQGLIIRLPTAQAHGGAEYYLPLSKALRALAAQSSWALEKKNIAHEIHFYGDWDWRGSSQAPQALWSELRQILAHLPEGISALIFSPSGIGCEWDERCRGASENEAVTAIKTFLEQMLTTLEKSLSPLPDARPDID